MQHRTHRGEQDVRAGWYYRPDYFSIARVGVPAIWFKSGVDCIDREFGWVAARYVEWIDTRYHQPADEVGEDWNLDGLVEDAELAFMLGAAVAGTDHLPTWFAGDEFEDVRLDALTSLASQNEQ